MNSPFKFLDPYTLADRDAFFGREEEIDLLYQLVFQTPLLLVYGYSGTGKTSLIQCGLASRFDGPDWYPFFIRRQDNLNDSLNQAISQALPEQEVSDQPLARQIETLFDYYLRPIYLIFDQFEELFILGDRDEQLAFARTIRSLLEAEQPCKVILVMREEFFGQLYYLEKEIPSIYDFRMRVEPMGFKKVSRVIRGSFERFLIQLEDPTENTERIYRNISAGKSGVQLPYLQVYLDMLWRENYIRTYGETEAPILDAGQYPKLELTAKEIEKFGAIEDVLTRFLQEQEDSLQELLKERRSDLPDNTVRQILDAFVTEEGTKRPINFQRHGEFYVLEEKFLQFLPRLPEDLLHFLLARLEAARLLRERDGRLELAHDSLAARINAERSEQQRRLNEQFNRLVTAYRAYPDTREYLSRRQLTLMEEFLPDLDSRLDESLRNFIRDSHTDADRREKAELEKAQRQAAIERDLADKANAALAEVRKKNISIFESFAGLGIELIRSLDHPEALEKMKVAVEIEIDGSVKEQALAEPISELLFFFAEGGRRPHLAREAAWLLLKLESNDDSTWGSKGDLMWTLRKCTQEKWDQRSQFRPLLRKLPFFDQFQSRYYPELAAVPLGKDGIFEMGSSKEEWGHQKDEQLHKVQLSAYQMSVTPVTFYQFALFSEAVDRGLASRTPYWGRFGDHPMVSVSWYETLEYANWLNEQIGRRPCYRVKKEKDSDPNNKVRLDYLKWKVDWDTTVKGFRLPTEAEWELAARGGVGAPRKLFAGSDNLDEVGWYCENSGDKPLSGDWDLNRIYDNNGRTHTVKNKADNGIGLYDMSGNVYEWCWDWYTGDYYSECENKGIVANPYGAEGSSDGRVIRGGSWLVTAQDCRTAYRFRSYPVSPLNFVGFRLVFVP